MGDLPDFDCDGCGDDGDCPECDGAGEVNLCIDDICYRQSVCIHGDGFKLCRACGGSGYVNRAPCDDTVIAGLRNGELGFGPATDVGFMPLVRSDGARVDPLTGHVTAPCCGGDIIDRAGLASVEHAPGCRSDR